MKPYKAEMSELVSLKMKRTRAEGSIIRALEFATSVPEHTDSVEISTRINSLKELFKEFCIYDDQIALIPTESSNIAVVEETYYKSQAALQRVLNTRCQNSSAQAPNQESNLNDTINALTNQNRIIMEALHDRTVSAATNELRLPPLTIPQFSGIYGEWPSFQDLYTTSVHTNVSLTKIQKFQYLKGLLRGEAAWQIRHMLVSEQNYDAAWERLVERYDRKKHIVNNYIKTFNEQHSIGCADAVTLRRLADTADEVVRGLEALGEQAQKRDPWLIHILLHKTDAETRQQWATHTSNREFPSFDELIKFINNRCDALEAFNSDTSTHKQTTGSPQTANKTIPVPTSSCCPKCSGNHPLFKCSSFKALDTSSRRRLVLRSKLCFNCLNDGHQTSSCTSSFRCHYCNDKHHSSLHQHTPIQSHHTTSAYDSDRNISTFTYDDQSPSHHTSPALQQSTPHLDISQSSFNPNIPEVVLEENTNHQQQPGVHQPQVPTHIPGKHAVPINNFLSNPTNASIFQLPKPGSQSSGGQPAHSTHSTAPNPFNVICHETQQTPISQSKTNTIGPTLLPTAIVYVKDKLGATIPCRALLDSGSMATFLSEAYAQLLGTKRINNRSSVRGLASTEVATTKGEVVLTVTTEQDEYMHIKALVLQSVTSPLPPHDIATEAWPWIRNFNLADPTFYKSQNVDLLIGADYFFQILRDGQIQHAHGSPILQNTMFGWVVAGQHQSEKYHTAAYSSEITIDCDIDKTLTKFWELENVTPPSTAWTEEELFSETHFKTHTRISSEGRFIVRLPFKDSKTKLGNSRRTAVSCLLSSERRRAKDPELQDQYTEFIREYIALGHMRRIPPSLVHMKDNQCFYLPHHAVVKPTSTTTKVRVVFNASRKTNTNISLNDILAVGPIVQRDLFSHLVNFRLFKIPMCADVTKMYRQIELDPRDWNYQRIVWRDNPSQPIQDFWITRVAYGTSSAPFLATRSLMEIANEYDGSNPKLSHVIRKHFYVDDLLTGASDEEDATKLRLQLEAALASRGFELRKWKSSAKNFIEQVPADRRDADCVNFNDDVTKILGLRWNPTNDCFMFHASIDTDRPVSKRTILAESAKIFDPLGLLSPTTVSLKILFQQLWEEQPDGNKLQWDDNVPEGLAGKWRQFKNEFSQFALIKVPRWIHTSNRKLCQLHGFSDASEAAYAAVIYCRSEENRQIFTTIIAAKTRVAPVKQLSLPRLELCGALLLAKLFESVCNGLNHPEVQRVAWTDSTIVLSWLNSTPRRWKTFVANPTSKISNILQPNLWKHVPSHDNPADLASRGVSPQVLKDSSIWWQGPGWLSQPEDAWPAQGWLNNKTIEEERSTPIQSHHANMANPVWECIIAHASSFSKVIRLISYWRRYIKKLQHRIAVRRNNGSSTPVYDNFLSTNELQHSTEICIRWVQNLSFSEEKQCLNSNKPLPRTSKLSALSPYIDAQGLLRVGGRLQNAHCSYNTKHPIILPRQHEITALIIRQYHQQYLHPGPTLLLAIIRQKYWIIGGRSTIRQHTHKCLSCFRFQRTTQQQLMGTLPEPRVQPSRPFLHCGIDYAGPIRIKLQAGRGGKSSKGYIALFICFSTKAIHIEMVSDLTSDAFIAALKRFVSRRGIPAAIYSDNGTNFVGAKRKLSEVYKLVTSSQHNTFIANFLAKLESKWHFIPPASPHFGGLWESGIKAMKAHIKRVIGDYLLTFEEMATLLAQIESVLNSRPLTSISDSDISSLDALTPGHFLIGTSLTALPDKNFMDVNPLRLSRWQQVQRITQAFWKQWSKEYLHSLNQRPKWRYGTPNLAVNDLVIIKEDNLPPSAWLLGRIIATHPGRDDLVRAVTLKTRDGELKRPIVKIAKLPTN